jgi:pre-mRNA-splicing factor ATP-dependent RNA helicase DHX38/PRP16
MELVSPIKDPTSDFAVLSRKGSALMREVRERKERSKSRPKFWEVKGTAMGNAIGLKDEEAETRRAHEAKEAGEDGSINYKKDSQFAQHMGSSGKDAAVRYVLERAHVAAAFW